MREMSLHEFVAFLPRLVAGVVIAEDEALEHASRIVEKEAKDSVGQYQDESGPFAAWAELAESTKADRLAQGYAENEPELRTGELRDSIEHTVHKWEKVAEIGSNSPIMVYQELGTATIPPRSILGGAAARKEKEVVEVLGGTVIAALIGEEVSLKSLPVF